MPEATMHENDSVMFAERDVRFSWQLRDVEPETVALGVESLPYDELWFGVFCTNLRHHFRSFLLGYNVHTFSETIYEF
ncbi:hypothetical protein DET61_1016 [Marinobacter nauticus]|uniref:Uncharacterized protein n=1 Tax=Marinobacter nauticus TaxID=2743 RepID=A0A368Y5I5_MARNT|nr:hypothetical protein DET61_1016 [Marinobacter nauticus]